MNFVFTVASDCEFDCHAPCPGPNDKVEVPFKTPYVVKYYADEVYYTLYV